MTTFKKHKVILLPTDVSNRANCTEDLIVEYTNRNEFDNRDLGAISISKNWSEGVLKYYTPQHLYILSDEEIKEGSYNMDDNGVFGPYEKGDIPVGSFKGVIISSTDEPINLPPPTDEFIQQWIDAGCPEEIEVEYSSKINPCKGYCDYCNGTCIKTGLSVNADNTINCRLIEDSWDEIFTNAIVRLHPKTEEWLKENYEAPKKK